MKTHEAKTCIHCGNSFIPIRKNNVMYCSRQCKNDGTRDTTQVRRDISRGTYGALNELIVSVDLINRQFHVFRALSPNAPFDLAVYKDGKLLRIEVTKGQKSASTGTISFPAHVKDKYDVLAIVFHDNTILYEPSI
jgi:PD-(D/E)XK endonuclease